MTNEERIMADAQAYASGTGDFYRKMGALFGYIAGATAVHDRAQVLVDALEWIKTYGPVNNLTVKFIDNAIEK